MFKQSLDLGNARLRKQRELPKHGVQREIKLFRFRSLRGERFFCLVVPRAVRVVQFRDVLQLRHQRRLINVRPKIRTVLAQILHATRDHLVGNFVKQTRHARRGAVVPRHAVHHHHVVNQGREGFNHGEGRRIVQRLQAFLEGREVLHVVLGFVQGVREP
jgi:hypothetical protein